MKYNAFLIFSAFVLIINFGIFADSDKHSTSVEEVLLEIRRELGLSLDDAINPDRVPPFLLEELGEAVMSEAHPDPEQHEWMENTMGGEGSESLATAHRWMGYRYLSGGYNYEQGYGMMGPGMMGNPDTLYNRIPYESPEDILKRRYAGGEINREEYLKMLEDLRK